MAVTAQLTGHQFDLDTLAELYPSGDPKVVQTQDGYFIQAAALDDHFQDAGCMREIAAMILAILNGYARVRDPGFRPARLMDRYINDRAGCKHVHIHVNDEARARDTVTAVVAGTAEARLGALNARVTTNSAIAAPNPAGPRLLALASSDSDVAELLTLFGRADALSWVELYKAYEIVRDAVGGGQMGLVGTGWITKDELGAFTGTANHPAASGPDGRHARGPNGTPNRTLTIEDSRRVIRDLANRWLDSLG